MSNEVKPTKGQEYAADVAALLRARNPLLWIVTREEARVESLLVEAAASVKYGMRTWDCGQGVADSDGELLAEVGSNDIGDTLGAIRKEALAGANRFVWVLRDLPPWLQGGPGMMTLRQLRNLAKYLPSVSLDGAQAIVVLSPSSDVPAELAGHATVLDWPLPDREEIAAILDNAIASLKPDMRAAAAPNGTREAAIDAAVGLSGTEAEACYNRSLVQLKGKIDPAIVGKEKRRVIAREKVLEWFDPLPGGLDAVGGLDLLKFWLVARKSAYSPAAREYGLPAPKGAFLVGISGCGKSHISKAIATAWGVPLLRLDLGALKSKFVGDSEANLRKALSVIQAIGRCVVWIDEIEKALAGATDGSADGGVSSDALGAVLNWMQERPPGAFVIATANDVSKLPPELLRKGRFDEVWWVDLPTNGERAAILQASLRSHGRDPADIGSDQLLSVAGRCEGFTGSEVAELVPIAMYAAFADGGREPTALDLAKAIENVVPLSKTMPEKIEALRKWSVGRARPATSAATATPSERKARQLDI